LSDFDSTRYADRAASEAGGKFGALCGLRNGSDGAECRA
jgi:hypothetical protein